MVGTLWSVANVLVGLPLALATLVVLRETLRGLVAVCLGLRVFELQWGAGRRRFARPIGTLDLALAPWPVAGAVLARSGSPRHHRFARIALAIAPALAQIAWIAMRSALDVPFPTRPPPRWDPLALLDLANAALLVLHGMIPVELSRGVRSDVRLLLDALTEEADVGRRARGSYYARLVRHHVERGRVDAAREALARGLVQLGPEPTLLACREQLEGRALDSVVDQGACADALESLIRDAEPTRARERATWSLGRRLRQAVLAVVPAGAVLATLGLVQADRIGLDVETRLRQASLRAAREGDDDRCRALLDRWAGWTRLFEVDALPPSAQRERHVAIARLSVCKGDPSTAAAHRGEALLAASRAARESEALFAVDLRRWVAQEVRVVDLLGEVADEERARRSHRAALATLHRAEQRLERVRRRLATHPEPEARDDALAFVTEAEQGLARLRESIRNEMTRKR